MALYINPLLQKASKRLGSINRMPSFMSNLYTFYYRSRTGNDTNPFVMLVQSKKTGTAFYTAKTGNRLMLGINLNYATSPETRNLLVNTLRNRGPVPWRFVAIIGKFMETNLQAYFRQYDVRKLRDLSVVDATKYLEESGFFTPETEK